MIGIVLGVIGGYVICSIISSSMGMSITPGISLSTIMAATLFSCAVGVFFGIYPAKKAAKLEPDRGFAAELMKTGLRWYFGVPVY